MSRTDQRRRVNLFSALTMSLFLTGTIFCASGLAADLDNAEVKSLDGLETRFFEHTYQKEDTEARLDRLEKLIYGEAKTGDQSQRLTALVAALPKNTDLPADPGTNNSTNSNTSQTTDDNSQPEQNPQTADNSAGDAEDYPTVDAIEQTVLGKTFRGVPIAKRLDQLELKAFNKTSQDPDLSERVGKLSEYVQKHMHKSIDQLVDPRTVLNYQSNGNADDAENVRAPAYVGSPGGTYGAGNYGGAGGYGGGSGSYGMNPPANPYARTNYGQPNQYGQQYGQQAAQPPVNAPEAAQVAWLESRVFGQPSNPSIPLIDRLKRLEQSVFPSESMDANVPISSQIKLLVNAVELMHNSNPANAPAQSGYQQAPQAQYPYQQSVTQNTMGTSAGSNFPSWPPQGAAQNQYSGYSASANQPGTYPYQNAPGTDTGTNQYEQQLNQMQQPAQQQPQQQQQEHSQGHPLLKGLAHALMSVGSMAAATTMMGGMGGMSNYANSGFGGYGNYGNYGTGMMPGYGFGGIHF